MKLRIKAVVGLTPANLQALERSLVKLGITNPEDEGRLGSRSFSDVVTIMKDLGVWGELSTPESKARHDSWVQAIAKRIGVKL